MGPSSPIPSSTSKLSNGSDTADEKEQTSTTPAVSPVQIAPVPNGGLNAWLQVLGGHFLFLNTWGIINTFGVYQTFYESAFLSSTSPSNISWIGTVQGFLLFIVGLVAGPVFDRGYLRTLLLLGSFLVVFGMMMTSISKNYYQVFLAQGVTIGIGAGLLFVPSVAIVAKYFSTKRATATGITAAGGSLGGTLYPIVFHRLQVSIGFGWATRVIAFIALATLVISLVVMRLPAMPKQPRALLEPRAFKEAPFTLFSIGLFLAFAGLYIPFFYVPSYALTVFDAPENLSFYLLAIMNAASIAGRIIPNFLADRLGALNVLLPCAFSVAILNFAWIGIKNVPGIVVFCILYGFFSGAVVSLPPSVLTSLSSDLSRVGTRMGMSFSFAGLGLLLGSPIAGATLHITGKFLAMQVFAGATALAGGSCLAAASWVHQRSKKQASI